jgi:hypothetical protein
MRVFHCDHCGNLVFFESTQCVRCGHVLAYLPDLGLVGSLDAAENDRWSSPLPAANSSHYKLCANYTDHDVCNWAIPADDPHALCEACRFTRVIPDLTKEENKPAWYRWETAKRRVIYSLRQLKCPLEDREQNPETGLAFDLLDDPADPAAPRIMTGHADGLVTLSLVEADDAEREKRRLQLNEPFRTLLGHLRHEIGHYYWDRLIRDGDRLESFRALFGDEREDYSLALERHYQSGPPTNWQNDFVSAYASAHPWEDWAETWAHYLHMTDTLETAAQCGLSIRPRRRDEPAANAAPLLTKADDFDRLVDAWFPLTYVMNNLNRGLGLPDGYPFVLSKPAVAKLRYVHETVQSAGEVSPQVAAAAR